MYGDNKDCPIRITALVGSNKLAIFEASNKLIKEFGWLHHSWNETCNVYGSVYSRILFHLGEKNG